MDKDDHIKRWLYEIISWVVVAVYLMLNIGVSSSNLPFLSLIVILPVINIVIIAAWFFFRGLRNSAITSIKHQAFLAAKPESQPQPQYGKASGQDYVPNVTIASELFEKISGNPADLIMFDISFKDYLQKGKRIVFHNKLDYGDLKRVEVVSSHIDDSGIEASFIAY